MEYQIDKLINLILDSATCHGRKLIVKEAERLVIKIHYLPT